MSSHDHGQWEVIRHDAVQALLGVLNDIGGGHPWNFNVITEAAEDALDAAFPLLLRDFLNSDAARDITGSWGFTTTQGDEFRAELSALLEDTVEHA